MQARDWSYDHTDPDERYGRDREGAALHPYSLDPARYQPRCRTCHIAFDEPTCTPTVYRVPPGLPRERED